MPDNLYDELMGRIGSIKSNHRRVVEDTSHEMVVELREEDDTLVISDQIKT